MQLGENALGKRAADAGYARQIVDAAKRRGRLLSLEDDKAPGEPHVVVLSYDYWRTRFGADPRIVGRTLLAAGDPVGPAATTRRLPLPQMRLTMPPAGSWQVSISLRGPFLNG